MRIGRVLGVATALAVAGIGAAQAADYDGPYHHHYAYRAHRAAIGECVRTRVEEIGPVLGGGPVIRYADGVVQAYDGGMEGQATTRPGDPIKLCLVSFSRDCGTFFPNDQPGRTYATGNLRTGAAWTSPDVRASCQAR